jgi:MinD-like ATPase involved in chromosome partitioning or flagellar assembly
LIDSKTQESGRGEDPVAQTESLEHDHEGAELGRELAQSLLSGYEQWFDSLRDVPHDLAACGRLWAVAGPEGSGKTYLTACLAYLLSTSRERAVPVDATLSMRPGARELNGELVAALSDNAMRSLDDATFEALNALRQVVMLRYEALMAGSALRTGQTERLTHVVLDLGPGTVHANLAFLPLADDPVVVTRVDQESFVRTLMVIYRSVLECWRLMFRKRPKALALTRAEIGRQGEVLYADLKAFVRKLAAEDQDAAGIAAVLLERFRPGVVFNAVSTDEARTAIEELWQLAAQEVGVELDYLGSLPADPGVAEFTARVRPHFVSSSHHREAAWAAREIARKLRVADDRDEEETHLGVVLTPAASLPDSALICRDLCDKWSICEYRDPGYACTIQYLQPDEYGLIKPVHLERFAQAGTTRSPDEALTESGRAGVHAVSESFPEKLFQIFRRPKE